MKLTHFLLEEKQYTLKKKKKRVGGGEASYLILQEFEFDTHVYIYKHVCQMLILHA